MMATNHRIHDYQVISGLFPINDRAHDMIDMDRYSNCDTSQGQCECNMGNDDHTLMMGISIETIASKCSWNRTWFPKKIQFPIHPPRTSSVIENAEIKCCGS